MARSAEFLVSIPEKSQTGVQISIEAVHPERLLPLSQLQDIDHWGFDVEETIFDIQPGYLATNFAHFLMYELQKKEVEAGERKSEDVVHPADYLMVMPSASLLRQAETGEDREALWEAYKQPWREYQVATMQYIYSQVSQPELIIPAITNFVYAVHSDESRGKDAAKLLGFADTAELWKRYGGEFWPAVATTPEQAWNVIPYEVKPGAIEFLNVLSEKGKTVHFITNADYHRVKFMLGDLWKQGYNGDFNFISCRQLRPDIVGEAPKRVLKPAPDALVQVYTDFALVSSDALGGKMPFVYIGNALSDLGAAQNANAAFAIRIGEQILVDDAVFPHYVARDFKPFTQLLKQ